MVKYKKKSIFFVEIESNDESIEVHDALLWLRNSSQPWPKVLEYWQLTSSQRWIELVRENLSVEEYVAQYPALDNEKGYTLVNEHNIIDLLTFC